jgi:hypothetical protein
VSSSLPTEFKRREEAPEMGLRTESKHNPNTDHSQSSHQHLTVHSNTSNQSNKGWVYLDDRKLHPLCKVLEVIDRSILADTNLHFGCYLEKFAQDFTVATLCHHFSLVNWTKDHSQNEVLLCYNNFICVICHICISQFQWGQSPSEKAIQRACTFSNTRV